MPVTEYETTGKVRIGGREASGSFVKLRARADDLSITTPIGSIAFSPREVVAFRPLKGLLGYGGFQIVHTRDGRHVQFWCRDADGVLARIAGAGFVPRGTPGGGPDPSRAARRDAEDRADNRRLLKIFSAIAVVLVAVVGAIAFGLWYSMTDNDVYRSSWATVQAEPRVAAVTGRPMTSGTPSGSLRTSGSTGLAKLRYAVDGPTGRGTVEVDGTKADGRWRIDRLVFVPDGAADRTIDLSEAPSKAR